MFMYIHDPHTQSCFKATLPSAMHLLNHCGLSVSTAVDPAHSATCEEEKV
jgi:hypothetical protein